jgi:endonuclease YncB( thermonuclease family)
MLFSPRVTASRKIAFVLPWLLILALAAASLLQDGPWPRLPRASDPRTATWQDSWQDSAWRDLTTGRHRVEALTTFDGDTFLARVRLSHQTFTTRVRLRSIDAPEMEARCARERQLAERATAALRTLLRQGEVTIFDVGPDKYAGRIVAEVATKNTPDVSAALVRGGFGRAYAGGHRDGWC